MSAIKFVLYFAAAGIVLPATWFGVYRIFPESVNQAMSALWVGDAVMLLWPSSILLIGDPDEVSVTLPIMSAALNSVFYGALGWLLWLGMRLWAKRKKR